MTPGKGELSFTVNEKPSRPRGRPSNPASLAKAAARIGISQATASRALLHVAAVKKYPELAPFSSTFARAAVKVLDRYPDLRKLLGGPCTKDILDVAAWLDRQGEEERRAYLDKLTAWEAAS